MSEHEEALAHIAVLAKQLAAERLKREREMADYETLCRELREQIAAERSKAEELSTALRLLKLGATSKIDRKVAEVALEKVSNLNAKQVLYDPLNAELESPVAR